MNKKEYEVFVSMMKLMRQFSGGFITQSELMGEFASVIVLDVNTIVDDNSVVNEFAHAIFDCLTTLDDTWRERIMRANYFLLNPLKPCYECVKSDDNYFDKNCEHGVAKR